MPAASSGSGSRRPGYGEADGPTGVQPPSASATPPRCSVKPEYVDALRPACASWMPAVAPWPCTKSTIRAQAACCSSFQIPVSSGEILPSGTTAVASLITRPAPPRAKEPRWTRCQSFGTPSTAEYWHIGATHTRLRTVTPRRAIGVKSWLTGWCFLSAGCRRRTPRPPARTHVRASASRACRRGSRRKSTSVRAQDSARPLGTARASAIRSSVPCTIRTRRPDRSASASPGRPTG